MTVRQILLCTSALLLTANEPAMGQVADAQANPSWSVGFSKSWLAQIGVTAAISAQAKGGAGFKIGFVDTGTVPTQMDVTGRVSSLSACAAITFVCSKGFVDDNGHGTATAAIAAGAVTAAGKGMAGVAPSATIIAEKSLGAAASGNISDVANGIVRATNAGAQVINLSLTYSRASPIVDAINYAASKGAIIVFAGGNSATALLGGQNSTGFTPDALKRLVFAGSVNASNVLSSFSNKPGTGSAIAGTLRNSYASLWVMAPGEYIRAPGIEFGADKFASWTGTSMSAPMVSGALALLETTWPILRSQGTATSVLFQTATNLGAGGVDTTYGNGLLNVTRAFKPIGTTTVMTGNGTSLATTSLTTTTITSSSLGPLSAIEPLLSNYTTFDSFKRNFTTDLSFLLNQVAGSNAAGATSLSPAVINSSSKLANGGTLDFTMTADRMVPRGINPGADSFANAMQASASGQPTGAWVMTLNDPFGTNISVGHGFPATASFAEAMWGKDALAVSASYTLQGVTDLSSLATGGHFMAFGTDVGQSTRIGFSLTEAGMPDYSVPSAGRLMPQASAVTAGVTTELSSVWTGGMTMSLLGEQNGMLGAQYTGDGALSLGHEHRSVSLGFSSALRLGENTGLLFNAVLARTQGAHADGLITGTSPMLARSYGMALVQQNLLGAGDHASLSISKPLRVFDGGIDLATASVDSDGNPITGVTRIALLPAGNETDFATGYAKFWGNTNLSASLNLRQDADNLKGVTDLVLRLGTGVRF